MSAGWKVGDEVMFTDGVSDKPQLTGMVSSINSDGTPGIDWNKGNGIEPDWNTPSNSPDGWKWHGERVKLIGKSQPTKKIKGIGRWEVKHGV